MAGDLRTHAGVCGALARDGGCSVFALDYRRAPEHPFPTGVEDALAALAWLREGAAEHGLDPARLGLAGDSAGGALAAAAAADPRAGHPQAGGLALLLLLCPILDLAGRSGSRETYGRGYFISPARFADDVEDYLQGASPTDPRASPGLGPPPRARAVRVHAAACDPFRDEALHYAARLAAEGLDVHAAVHPGMIHYFYALPRAISAARTALRAIGAEVRAALERA